MNREHQVDQMCAIYGDRWRDIVDKKWTFHHASNPEESHVFLIVDPGPLINSKLIFDTKQEAERKLALELRDRIKIAIIPMIEKLENVNGDNTDEHTRVPKEISQSN